MRKVEKINLIVDRKTPPKTEQDFVRGYINGMDHVKAEILEVLKEENLEEFLSTEVGHNLWDSTEVRLVLRKKTIFILKMNYEVILDTLGIIGKNNEFTKKVENLLFDDYVEIDGVNYILVKEKRNG
jgi:archaellum biogenesis ATPase FlaH